MKDENTYEDKNRFLPCYEVSLFGATLWMGRGFLEGKEVFGETSHPSVIMTVRRPGSRFKELVMWR